MGLPMVLGILREIGGNLEIESEKGKGCTVFIRLRPHAEIEVPHPALAAAPNSASVMSSEPVVSFATVNNADEIPKELLVVKSPEPSSKVPDLLVNDSVEKLLEGPDLIEAEPQAELPPPPPPEFSPEALEVTTKNYTSKVDRPKINLNKKASKLDQVEVQLKRPGVKL
jgi:hypothetical protein